VPRKDDYHEAVVHALLKDRWTITDDPFTVLLPDRVLYIDLRIEKATEQLVLLVEIKGFTQESQVEALAAAIGKYLLYRAALELSENTDALYLAVPNTVFQGVISETLGRRLIEQHHVLLIVFDPVTEEVVQWVT
jgi:hypothetical protein